MSGQQHVEFHRKVQMRRHLLRRWPTEQWAAYVPFIGDGDLAVELYHDRLVVGADINAERVATARKRTGGYILEADCDGWPFTHTPGLPVFGIGDFDAYAEPYSAFRSFWGNAALRNRVLLFFTDGQRQSMMRVGSWVGPNGEHRHEDDLAARQVIFHRYYAQTIAPWFVDYVAPWRVVDTFRYLCGWMLYWGAVIER